MSNSYTDDELSHLKNVGETIRELRSHSALSQEQLAHNSGLDRTYIGSVERGERNVSLLNLKKIADALSVNTSPSSPLKDWTHIKPGKFIICDNVYTQKNLE